MSQPHSAHHASQPDHTHGHAPDAVENIVHSIPVVLPVVAGLLWNVLGFGLHPLVDTMLAGLGVAVVPLCLVAIGMTLAVHGVRGKLGEALRLSALKLLLLPQFTVPYKQAL